MKIVHDKYQRSVKLYHRICLDLGVNPQFPIGRLGGSFQLWFFLAMTGMIQLLLYGSGSYDLSANNADIIYYGKTSLRVNFSDYAKTVVYRVAVNPEPADVKVCNKDSFKVHDAGKLTLRHITPYQTLGDTNIHAISAYVDDRLRDKPFIRIITVGLAPGPTREVFCSYDCPSEPVQHCSVRASAAILLAGNHTDYVDDWDRKSLMNANMIACPIRYIDKPENVTMVTTKCGYSHNLFAMTSLNVQGVVAPPMELGVCVRPLNSSKLGILKSRNLLIWSEYMRLMGADGLHFYVSALGEKAKKVLENYANEKLPYVHYKDWSTVGKHLEESVSDEAAINDCLYQNMMKYRYLLVVSFEDWLMIGQNYENLQQLIRSQDFKDSIKMVDGYRLTKLHKSSTQRAFLVSPRNILGFAARHFVPLSGESIVSYLEPSSVSVESTNRVMKRLKNSRGEGKGSFLHTLWSQVERRAKQL